MKTTDRIKENIKKLHEYNEELFISAGGDPELLAGHVQYLTILSDFLLKEISKDLELIYKDSK